MNQVQQLSDDIDHLIHRYAKEWDLDYSQVVGVLMMKAHLLMDEAKTRSDEL
jgi:hypothetical protein